ncbi:hypothetical protein [Vibrio sp. PNB22_8_1]|uniref:hypothetical protein n=1 Tax=unclassified Vibrio TaxID=2614977 RepID=UPI00406A4E75
MDIYITRKLNAPENAILKAILKKISDACHINVSKQHTVELEDYDAKGIVRMPHNTMINFTQKEVEYLSQYKFKSSNDFFKSLDAMRGEFGRLHLSDNKTTQSHGFFVGKIGVPESEDGEYEATINPFILVKLLGYGRDNLFLIPCGCEAIGELDERSRRLFLELVWICRTKSSINTELLISKVKRITGADGIRRYDEFKEINRAILKPCIEKINASGWLKVECMPVTAGGEEVGGRGKIATKVKLSITKTEKFK